MQRRRSIGAETARRWPSTARHGRARSASGGVRGAGGGGDGGGREPGILAEGGVAAPGRALGEGEAAQGDQRSELAESWTTASGLGVLARGRS